MIEDKYIDQILDRINIVDVISEYVPSLKKAGKDYKGCCPFHEEKTPSFSVNPARGVWHCFGGCAEGGNVIKFLTKQGMSFRDATFQLAAKCGVTIVEDSTPLTTEQIQAKAKKESLLIINEKVSEFYAKLLPLDKVAKTYVEGRWGATFPYEFGIGFAPKEWTTLVDFAKLSGLSQELMIDVGLLKQSDNGRVYDAYRNRVMIPIRDKYNRVTGFTARDLSGEEDVPKYINSASSDIYQKSESIFGIDTASRQAAKEDKFYCVEGAPDVLRLQSLGINNTVASLGAAWTVNQFLMMKKLTSNICFLPDADPIKKDEKYGAGTKMVMTNGKLAMMQGFNVSVKEILLSEDKSKQDPDSFCTNTSKFNLIEEEDFITWYARYVFKGITTTEDQHAAVTEICDLITSLGDDVKEDMYVSKLMVNYSNKPLWTKAIKHAKKLKKAQKVLEKSKGIDRDLYNTYGFFEENNCYKSIVNNSGEMQWSNFIMEPLFHIKDSLMPKRLYKIRNQNKQEEIIELKQEDLISLARFKQRVEGLGNYIWLASDKELTKLKMFLYEQTETALEITQLGWNKKGFFAYGNGVYDTDWHKVDEYGVVRLPNDKNYYLPASSKIYRDETKLFQFERKFVHLNYNAISLHDYTEQMINVSGDNAKVGICFLLATLFRDVVIGHTKSFPILNLFGPKGSGKSELGHSLMSFFIIENIPPNIQNSTIASMADLVAQCSNALVHIDEFKNSIDLDKREFLKGLWDGAGRSRMNMDRDKKREITSVDCGVILSGQEMATADIALFSRMIYLTFDKSDFTNDQKKKFNDLVKIRKMGVSHLVLEILKHRDKVEQRFAAEYSDCMMVVSDYVERVLHEERIEDRILRNWITPLAVFRALECVLDFPFEFKEMVKLVSEGIVRQNKECKTNNELANFWNIVSFLQQDGEIYNEADYRIDYMKDIKTNIMATKMEFSKPRPILRIRKNRIFMLYKKLGKQIGDSVLPEGSLLYYLENSGEYLGKMNSVRFKSIKNGFEQKIIVSEEEGGKSKVITCVDQALCFDYEKIVEKFSINIEVNNEMSYEQTEKKEPTVVVQKDLPF